MTHPDGTNPDPDDFRKRRPTASTGLEGSTGSDPDTDFDSIEALGDLHRQLGPAWLRSVATGSPSHSSLRRIGRFEVIEPLGSGAFGDVLLVRDSLLDRPRAMKVPRFDVVESGSTRTRFFREAKAAAALDHPNVVRVFDADEVGPVCFLIMEYCPSGSLAAWLADRPEGRMVPPRWAAQLVASLADGVEHAHSRGLLHRDLKPSNVLLVVDDGSSAAADGLPRFIPKVADFGLVKILDEPAGSDRTASDALVGTLAYMAPEQAGRNPSRISAATDVYGLGTILYELIAGHRPFIGLGQVELIDNILRQEPRPLPPDLPIELETICRKCLAKLPGDRYATAGDLAADLRRWLAGEPIRARRSPVWKQARAWTRRHPARIAAIGLAGLVALVVAGISSWFEAKASQEATGWLDRLGNANVMALPELVRMRKFDDSRIVAGAERLFREGTSDQKLAAAVFLAPGRSDCAEHAIERLLTIEPGAVSPLIRSLDRRLPGLASILENIVAGSTPAGASLEEREALDRRRARAATVLILIGQGETGWQLLRFKPDPQARSFLVHDLGPSGVDPETILNRIAAEREPSSGHALILALGEVPDGRWSAASRKRVSDRLLEIYRGDPNRGVHGSAKWYLKRWKPEEEMHAVDVELAKRHEANPPAEWRVSKSLLTFVTIPDPERGRVFEILDTEVTRKVFGRFRSEHRHDQANSPELDSPANSITYHDAAGFCEWLNREEHFSESYRHIDDPKIGPKFEPLPGYLDRTGYRLVTLEESMLACKAGTTTRRYFGESNALLASYARSFAPGRTRMYPVASLKPNDYGVFDLLGNAIEIGQSTRNPIDPTSQALLYGGSTKDDPSKLAWDYRIDGLGMSQRSFASYFGFRIARTLSGMLSRPIRQPPSGQ